MIVSLLQYNKTVHDGLYRERDRRRLGGKAISELSLLILAPPVGCPLRDRRQEVNTPSPLVGEGQDEGERGEGEGTRYPPLSAFTAEGRGSEATRMKYPSAIMGGDVYQKTQLTEA